MFRARVCLSCPQDLTSTTAEGLWNVSLCDMVVPCNLTEGIHFRAKEAQVCRNGHNSVTPLFLPRTAPKLPAWGSSSQDGGPQNKELSS